MDLELLMSSGDGGVGPDRALAALLCAFVLAQLVAWIYCLTYRGFSYSRTFVHAMVLGAVVAAVVTSAIGNSLARGIGMLGALAIVRFRTQIRDPRDIIFLFATIALGVASGAQAYAVALVGCLAFGAAALYLHWTPFASLQTYEGLVRFMAKAELTSQDPVLTVLEECCSHFRLSSMREALQGDGMEYTYQVRLRDPSYQAQLTSRLNQVPGVWDAGLIMNRATVEI